MEEFVYTWEVGEILLLFGDGFRIRFLKTQNSDIKGPGFCVHEESTIP